MLFGIDMRVFCKFIRCGESFIDKPETRKKHEKFCEHNPDMIAARKWLSKLTEKEKRDYLVASKLRDLEKYRKKT